MIPEELRAALVKQHYHIVGEHAASKLCHWTKSSIRTSGKKFCYKQKFYSDIGIKSHRCMQCTTSLFWCTQNCLFCWRAVEHKLIEKVKWLEPLDLIDNLIEAQRILLTGFGGLEEVDKDFLKESRNPNQAALSLTGESILYPYFSDLLKEFHKRKFTTFLVTNGTLPEKLKELETLPTQLYISLCAPDKEIHKKTCNPIIENAWEKLQESLELLSTLKTRTVLRLTLVKNLNMIQPEEYAKLIEKASPRFIECKAYMAVGFSRERLGPEYMPSHSEIKEFAGKIAEKSGYKIADEQEASRVALLKR